MKQLNKNDLTILRELVRKCKAAKAELDGPRIGETERLRDLHFTTCIIKWSESKDELAEKVCELLHDN